MEHVSQGASASVGSLIGALELGVDPATIRLPNDSELESTMSFGPDPTKAISCPTMLCNLTKPAGCRLR
jgi:hypothetical protein